MFLHNMLPEDSGAALTASFISISIIFRIFALWFGCLGNCLFYIPGGERRGTLMGQQGNIGSVPFGAFVNPFLEISFCIYK